MGKDKPFKPIEYECPICGERTTFGTHFCKGEKGAEERQPRTIPLKPIAAASVAILMVLAFLWQMIGAFSLVFLVAAPIVALAALGLRHSPLFRSAADYKALVRLSGGDKAAVERLISMEGIKDPKGARKDHILNLLRQWRRDAR